MEEKKRALREMIRRWEVRLKESKSKTVSVGWREKKKTSRGEAFS